MNDLLKGSECEERATSEIGGDSRNWVSEFWNAKDSYDYAARHGYAADMNKASCRMQRSVREIESLGEIDMRGRMPTLDELEELEGNECSGG